MEPPLSDPNPGVSALEDALKDPADSPFENVVHEEIRSHVEEELRNVSEPYRTTVILRDLEEMSYEEIAEITEVSLGTVKSRLTRGREALKQRLTPYIREVGQELGLGSGQERRSESRNAQGPTVGRRIEVRP